MPISAPKPCSYPGCGSLSYKSRCNKHLIAKHGWLSDSVRGDRTARGYGAVWDKLRKQVLIKQNGLCQPCFALNKITAASEVDHIVAKSAGGTDKLDNLQAICKNCHKAKTYKESRSY